ncbi:MAG: beta-galactosidase [Firmicutes bacterium]|nr:beta-galactosidase [Bacillota bacterium]
MINHNHIYLGTAYYPEHWPRERWAEDVRLMKDAGLEVIRMAELAWATIQPSPEEFDFEWIDEFLSVAEQYEMKIVLGTPTEAPPSWMWRRYPEIVATDAAGFIHGGRGRYCYNNRHLQGYIRGLVDAMAVRYGQDPRVIGWQIDNELRATRCYCRQCREDFILWLQGRYGTIDALNEAWGTVFWSQRYRNWDDVDLPTAAQLTVSTSQQLDHMRFASWSATQHLKRQVDIIRQHTTSQFVTHNSMGLYPWLDLYEVAKPLDFIGWDSYPAVDSDNFETVMAHDLVRNTKPGVPFWLLEQKNGYFNGSPYNLAIEPGLVRLWAYQDIARGANGVLFYRWRSNRYNVEQNPNGILRHDGTPRRVYFEIAQLARELKVFNERIAGTHVEAQVAILWSYDQEWAESAYKQYPAVGYREEVAAYHRAITQLGLTADVLPPTADLSRYRLAIAPMLSLVNEEILQNLEAFVREGGHLVMTIRSGVKSWSNVVFDVSWPGLLGEMLGMKVLEFDAPPADQIVNRVSYGGAWYPVEGWAEVLEPSHAEVLARYTEKFYSGSPAITRNQYQNGSVTYVGVKHQPQLLKALLSDIAKLLGLRTLELPKGVFRSTREGVNGRFTFYLNMKDSQEEVLVDPPGNDLLSGQRAEGSIVLEPWDLLIVEER